jgi:amino acid transporter
MAKETLPVGPRNASFWRSIKLVAWSFFGIRSSSQYQQDLAKVNPMHVVLVGIVAALLLVVGLITLVHWVVAK